MRALLPAAALLLALTACGPQPSSSGGDPGGPASDSATAGGTAAGTAARGSVAGTVRAADGSPLTGAVVVPRSLDSPAQPVPELAVVTDRQGGYRWTLPPGRYELAVQVGERRALPVKTVTVQAGRTATVDW